MMDVLNAALSFPTVVFTVMLGLSVLFWSTVIMGGVDPNAMDGDADLHTGGDADLHGDHGDIGHADHGDHGDHGHADVSGGGILSSVASFLNIGSVPVSVVFSAIALFGWVMSMMLQLSAGPWLASVMPAIAAGTTIFGVAGIGSMVLAGFATRPLRDTFKIESRHAEDTIVDHICTIVTSKVTEEFGQATYATKGAPLNLSVRCKQSNTLKKGAQAVIIGYDAVSNTYEVGELEPERPLKSATEVAAQHDGLNPKRLKEVSEALRKAGAK